MNDLTYLVGGIILFVLYYFLFHSGRGSRAVPKEQEMEKELLDITSQEKETGYDRLEQVIILLKEPCENNPEWECAKQLNSTYIYKKKTENASLTIIKAFTVIENTTAETVLNLIFDVSLRSQWDIVSKNFTLLEKFSENHDFIRFEVDSPMPALVAPREFLQYRLWKKQGDSYEMVFWSEEKPEIPVPQGYTRAETIYAGHLIVQEGCNVRLMLINSIDMRGNIPLKLINTMAPLKSMEWIKKLVAACSKKLVKNMT